MLVSIDWIKDFVDVPNMDPNEIGSKFTLATAEVEDVIVSGELFEKVHTAHVQSMRKHPEADKLNLVTLKLNEEGKTIEVVCGAANVREGLNVCYAPTGTYLPAAGFTLEPKKIRGVMSEGMICSDEELGFADKSEGIIELPEDAPVGVNLIKYMNQKKDILLEVDNKSLTHRPDLWGHLGLAREFGAIFGNKLKNRFTEEWANGLKAKFTNDDAPIKVKVESDSSSLGYYGLSVSGVKVTDSPDWIKGRLNAVGLRPINSIVDISNYVMLELGMPLHIFDRDKISGDSVIIKRANDKEVFKTLDEVDRVLTSTDTVICDANGPLVLGGIMGGLNSGVEDQTSNLFIEVANWHAADVRRTSTRLGLRTDSSQRYEKTLDSNLMERTMLRTLELILELNPEAKVVGNLQYDGKDEKRDNILKIKTSVSKIESVLGHSIGEARIVEIFTALDFDVENKGDSLEITVPTYRATKDVEYEADLIEEIGRIIGYDNITPVPPEVSVSPVKLIEAHKKQRKIKDFLVYNANATEVMTYPLIGEKLLAKAKWPTNNNLKLLNAISEDANQMRPSIIPSILEKVALNSKNSDHFNIFEIGRSYLDDAKNFSKEENQLVIAFYDKGENPFMNLLNTTDRLLKSLNVPFDICDRNPKFKNDLIPEQWVGMHPYEFLNVRIMGRMQGGIVSVHPILLKDYKIKGHLSIAVINLSNFENNVMKDKTKYSPLAKYPSSDFDCTVVVDNEVKVGTIIDSLKKVKMKELVSKKIVTVFDLGLGKKAVTVRTTFFNPKETLSSEIIKKGEDRVIEILDQSGFPLKL